MIQKPGSKDNARPVTALSNGVKQLILIVDNFVWRIQLYHES